LSFFFFQSNIFYFKLCCFIFYLFKKFVNHDFLLCCFGFLLCWSFMNRSKHRLHELTFFLVIISPWFLVRWIVIFESWLFFVTSNVVNAWTSWKFIQTLYPLYFPSFEVCILCIHHPLLFYKPLPFSNFKYRFL